MERETPFEILMRRPGSETVQQLLSLVAGWAA
jgi:hypothetical protein